MLPAKLLFNASLVVATLSIILMVASIIFNEPFMVLANVAILAISILCALLNYKMI